MAVKIDELPMKDQEALIKADEATQARQRDQCSNRAGFSRTTPPSVESTCACPTQMVIAFSDI